MLNKLATKYRRRRLAKLEKRLEQLIERTLVALDRWARLCGAERCSRYAALRREAADALARGSAGAFFEDLAKLAPTLDRSGIAISTLTRAGAIFNQALAAADKIVSRIDDLKNKLGEG